MTKKSPTVHYLQMFFSALRLITIMVFLLLVLCAEESTQRMVSGTAVHVERKLIVYFA